MTAHHGLLTRSKHPLPASFLALTSALSFAWLGACAGTDAPARADGGGGGSGNPDVAFEARSQAQCYDNIDNDGDGKTDFPREPGCESPDDDSEQDPAVTPECSDGIDNDDDGRIDHPNDLGCRSAAETDESRDPLPDACGPGIVVRDITKNAAGGIISEITAETMSAHQGSCGGADTRERAFLYRLTSPGKRDLVISTVDPGTSVNTVVYVRAVCKDPATELPMGCNDDATTMTSASEVVVRGAAPGKYYVLVDGKTAGATGSFKLKITVYIPEGEPCGSAGATETCRPGLMCQPAVAGGPSKCSQPRCRDGVDNDTDGKTDFPADPGCDDAGDNDEADPAVKPECADGVDNDMDGKTDFPADPGCMAASEKDESSDPLADACGAGTSVRDITKAAMATGTVAATDTPGPHQGSCGGAEGREQVFLYRLAAAGKRDLTVTTADPGTTADTVLYVRTPGCAMPSDEPAGACNDDVGAASKASEVVLAGASSGKYHIFVDGKPAAPGAFVLRIKTAISRGEPCGPPLMEMCAAGLVCKPPAAGAPAVCAVPACKDGAENDAPADGKVDFPADPGCATPDDDDESDPCPGAGCPRCADGIDNDGDTQIDFPADPHCAAASDDDEREECVAGLPIDTLTPAGVTGMTAGASLTTGSGMCAADGPERVYQFIVSGTYKSIAFSTEHPETGIDTVVYVRQPTCASTAPADQKACHDDASATAKKARAVLDAPEDGKLYYVFVDSKAAGAFKLTVTRILGEGAACVSGAADVICDAGLLCKGSPGASTCQKPLCNDGIDNDSPADGKADFPSDPGCAGPLDDDEADDCPAGPRCPQCGNQMDDDADGTFDFSGGDTGCVSASDPLEVKQCKAMTNPSPPVTLLTDDGAMGELPAPSGTGGSGRFQGSCSPDPFPFMPSAYTEVIYGYPVTRMFKSLTFSTLGSPASTNTLLYVKDGACNTGAEIACSDNFSGTEQSQITIRNPERVVHYVFVDRGERSPSADPFVLKVSGVLLAGAECDVGRANIVCDTGLTCKSTGAAPSACAP